MTGIPAAGSIAVSDLTGDTVVRIPADATVAAAAQAIVGNDVGVVVIGDDPHPAALISERDVARVIADGKDPAQVKASEVGSSNLVWCEAVDTVDKVATKMTDKHIRHILVDQGGTLVGIVSARDLLGVYAADADRLD